MDHSPSFRHVGVFGPPIRARSGGGTTTTRQANVGNWRISAWRRVSRAEATWRKWWALNPSKRLRWRKGTIPRNATSIASRIRSPRFEVKETQVRSDRLQPVRSTGIEIGVTVRWVFLTPPRTPPESDGPRDRTPLWIGPGRCDERIALSSHIRCEAFSPNLVRHSFSQTLHVWHICLHWVSLRGQCRHTFIFILYIYSIHGAFGNKTER